MFWWLACVWISSKAISDMAKGHCSQCNVGQWLSVIIYQHGSHQAPSLLPLLSFLISFTFTLSFPLTTILNHTRMELCPVAVFVTTFLQAFLNFHSKLIGFRWQDFECNSVQVGIAYCVVITSWSLRCMFYLPTFSYCLSVHYWMLNECENNKENL